MIWPRYLSPLPTIAENDPHSSAKNQNLYDIFELVKNGFFSGITVDEWIKKFIDKEFFDEINETTTPEEKVNMWSESGYDWVDIIYSTCQVAKEYYIILEIAPESYTDYCWEIYKFSTPKPKDL